MKISVSKRGQDSDVCDETRHLAVKWQYLVHYLERKLRIAGKK
jgi:hypothetical protein